MIIQNLHLCESCKFVGRLGTLRNIVVICFVVIQLCIFSSSYWSQFGKDEIVYLLHNIQSYLQYFLMMSFRNLLSEVFLLCFISIVCRRLGQPFFYIPQMLSAALIQIMYIVCLYSSRLLGMFIRSAQQVGGAQCI